MGETYPHRMMMFFRDETKGEHLQRVRRAETNGLCEKCTPLAPMMAENLVNKNATTFAAMLHKLGMRFSMRRGKGRDSFAIEVA